MKLYYLWDRHATLLRGGGEIAECAQTSPEAPETFRARKTIFSSSVSKNGEVYTFEKSCMKRDFAMALRARTGSRAFEKRAPDSHFVIQSQSALLYFCFELAPKVERDENQLEAFNG